MASWGRTIPVGKDQLVTTLHHAVEMAADGDTIILTKGIYREGNVTITRPVSIFGEKGAVLDGEHKYEILTITGTNVVIRGILFRNSGYTSMYDYASIAVVSAAYVILEGNTIEGAYFGIHIANSRNCIVRNNTISSVPKTEQTSGNGIHMWKCESMLVKENDITGHRDGIYMEFVTNSFVQYNNSHENLRYGLHFMFSNNDAYTGNTFRDNGAGVAVMYSKNVIMQKNMFQHNWGANAYGLLLKEISDGMISHNQFEQNTVAIVMESTNRVTAELNAFRQNGWAIRIQASCNGNNVVFNNFHGNTFDVSTNGSMMLNSFSYNYWDKYEGYDLDKNNVGDIPYHPVSMYSMVIEQNPNALILLRSFMVSLLDKAEKAIPSLTPELFIDDKPLMEAIEL
jgi:nitrous oxidase accessory protein